MSDDGFVCAVVAKYHIFVLTMKYDKMFDDSKFESESVGRTWKKIELSVEREISLVKYEKSSYIFPGSNIVSMFNNDHEPQYSANYERENDIFAFSYTCKERDSHPL